MEKDRDSNRIFVFAFYRIFIFAFIEFFIFAKPGVGMRRIEIVERVVE